MFVGNVEFGQSSMKHQLFNFCLLCLVFLQSVGDALGDLLLVMAVLIRKYDCKENGATLVANAKAKFLYSYRAVG